MTSFRSAFSPLRSSKSILATGIVLGAGWRYRPWLSRFEYVWTPEKDCIAWLMFFSKQPATVDLAGITVTEKP